MAAQSSVAPWPRMFAPPAEVLRWLNQQRPADEAGKRAVLSLRWLLLAELERSVPEPPPASPAFATAEINPPDDLTSGQ